MEEYYKSFTFKNNTPKEKKRSQVRTLKEQLADFQSQVTGLQNEH